MSRTDRPYDGLKRHVPSNLAVLAGVVAGAMPVLGATFVLVPHGYVAARSSPLYWVLVGPLALWVWGAISFDPWAVRLLAPLLLAAPLLAAAEAVLSGGTGGDLAALWSLTSVAVTASALGALALRRSPLWPFGGSPDR